MTFLRRIKNLYSLSALEISPEKKEQIQNVINEPPVKKAIIIKRKSIEDEIKEILEDK